MNLLMMHTMVIITLSLIMMMMIITIGKKTIIDTQKSTPFECGFNPMEKKRLPFSIHFFLIAVLFLIFDIEIIIIMPMILTMKTSLTSFWSMTSIFFVMILLTGLFHEWINGMLNWTK
nr:NADH dehydrogenase subunit 3 [Dikraneurini sp. SL-2021a]